jgi:hypothetical protein
MRRGGLTQLIVLLVVIGGALAWGYLATRVESGIKQPIEFPHKTHLQMRLPCTTCHQRAERDAVAGRPPTVLCLGCHMGGDTQSEEIKKLRRFAETGGEIPWKRVWRLPSHVYFPHRIHVTVGKINCQTCHGPMETLERPPEHALKTLSMDECMACHDQRVREGNNNKEGKHLAKSETTRLLNDCLTCHR